MIGPQSKPKIKTDTLCLLIYRQSDHAQTRLLYRSALVTCIILYYNITGTESSSDMTELTVYVCVDRKHRSAESSPQSDQSLNSARN